MYSKDALETYQKKIDKTINEYKNKLAQRDVRVVLVELALAACDRRFV